jgi:precorrin-6Y C5,15-methyltransferase (decarboxylating)
MPLPGQRLWDVGAGSGAVAIEWLRATRFGRAIAIEREPARVADLTANAAALGVPQLEIREGTAPGCFEGLAPPDAIFVGGGLTAPGLLDACADALPPGGRLVANAVTLEAERVLLDGHARLGGELVRLEVSRASPVGAFTGWRPLMPVTQFAWIKR